MPLVPVAPTVVSALTCPKCNWTIFSRAHHDMHWCNCGEVAVDGGLEYLRVNYKTVAPKVIRLIVNATKRELYDDWNLNKGKFGSLPPECILTLAPPEETPDESQ